VNSFDDHSVEASVEYEYTLETVLEGGGPIRSSPASAGLFLFIESEGLPAGVGGIENAFLTANQGYGNGPRLILLDAAMNVVGTLPTNGQHGVQLLEINSFDPGSLSFLGTLPLDLLGIKLVIGGYNEQRSEAFLLSYRDTSITGGGTMTTTLTPISTAGSTDGLLQVVNIQA